MSYYLWSFYLILKNTFFLSLFRLLIVASIQSYFVRLVNNNRGKKCFFISHLHRKNFTNFSDCGFKFLCVESFFMFFFARNIFYFTWMVFVLCITKMRWGRSCRRILSRQIEMQKVIFLIDKLRMRECVCSMKFTENENNCEINGIHYDAMQTVREYFLYWRIHQLKLGIFFSFIQIDLN